MKKIGIVSGKFRIFHKGHRDVILKAIQCDIDKLVIIIHNQKEVKRYSTIEELKKSIQEVLKDSDKEYEIVYTTKEFIEFEDWENYVLEKFKGHDILMFNSKEDYQNIKLNNTFINCDVPLNLSASDIEKDPFNEENYESICNEFQCFLKKRVNVLINTTYSSIEFFLFDGDFEKSYTIESKNNHTIKLYELYKKILEDGFIFNDIYIITGPGSYTGTRVGVVFAKTIALEEKLDIYPVNLLEIIYRSRNVPVALDARGGKYFSYDGKKIEIKKEEDLKGYKKDLSINYNNIRNFLKELNSKHLKDIKINYLKEVL